MAEFKIYHTMLTTAQCIPTPDTRFMSIRKSNLAPAFVGMSAVTAVVMIPTRNQVKLTNTLFLNVWIVSCEHRMKAL